MTETVEIIISVLILGAAIIFTRQFHTWKIKRAYLSIVEDLKSQGAMTPETAITLPYSQRSLLKFGLRDHRPAALKALVNENIVGITEDRRYYILDSRV